MQDASFFIIYEDNHLIAVNKRPGDIVQTDKTGDISLDRLIKDHISKRDGKPGDAFLGVCHRLDRPVSGVVVFSKTSKALSRMNEIFRSREVRKIYWAIVKNKPPETSGTIIHHLYRDSVKNRTYAQDKPGEKTREGSLSYHIIGKSDNYFLLEIELQTGRHHQIRSQLAKIGCPVKGDLKYGFPRSNKNGGISLHAKEISFVHPVKKEKVILTATPPQEDIFKIFIL